MKLYNSFLKTIKNPQILFLFVFLLFILLIGLLFSKNVIEGLDLGIGTPSISDLTSSSVKKGIPEEYKFLAPIPDGSVWAPEIQDAFVTSQQKRDPSFTTETLKTPISGNKTWMQWVTQEEAKYFIDNKKWPYNEYITNYITDNPTFLGNGNAVTADQLSPQIPNRMVYGLFIAPQTVPQLAFSNQLFSLNSPQKAENGKYWQCTTDGTLQTKDGENGTMADNNDYSFFQSNVAGFSFTGEPCNACAIPQIKISGTFQDIYNSNQNTCKFTISGDTEAYKVYTGVYGDALGTDTNKTQ